LPPTVAVTLAGPQNVTPELSPFVNGPGVQPVLAAGAAVTAIPALTISAATTIDVLVRIIEP